MLVKRWNALVNYVKYRTKSVNEHGIHSPFVFNLLTQVFYNKTKFYSYSTIESLRSKLFENDKLINHIDLGAGSQINKNKQLTISQIAIQAAKSEKYAQLLFRLVNYFQPQTIIEFGTSLGISGAYLASGNLKAKLITMEGSPEIAAVAKQNFKALQLINIEQLVGNFDDLLPAVIKENEKLDFVFFDGNHRKEATINYFTQCLKNSHEHSVFVFDDIYWSEGMQKAWEEIKSHTKVTVTIDIFQMGIVFFRTEQVKQHFVVKY